MMGNGNFRAVALTIEGGAGIIPLTDADWSERNKQPGANPSAVERFSRGRQLESE